MQTYTDNITDKSGNALIGAEVTVYLADGTTKATLPANPIITGANGEFSFTLANGAYVVSAKHPTISEKRRTVILFDPDDAGFADIPTTDEKAALQASESPSAANKFMTESDVIASIANRSWSVFMPQTYGGTPDPGDDSTDNVTTATANSAALLAAIAAASAVGGIVWIVGTFYLGSTTPSGTARLVNFTGLNNWRMDGTGTLKVMSGLRNTGAGRSMSSWNMLTASVSASNWSIKNITIDANGANNLAWQASSPMTPLSWGAGDDITIDRVTFLNSSGRNVISGGWGAGGPSLRVSLTNSVFRNFGGAIAGNSIQNDHSVTYAVWRDSKIIGNTFENDASFSTIGIDVTAIEEHMMNSIVSHNIIRNVGVGIIVGPAEAGIAGGNNTKIVNNTMTEVLKWGVAAKYNPTNHDISNNNIEILPDNTRTSSASGMMIFGGTGVKLCGNIITLAAGSYTPVASLYGIDLASSGVGSGSLTSFSMNDNQIIGAFNTAIFGYFSANAIYDFQIMRNKAIDFTTAGIKIQSDGTATVSYVVCKDNIVNSPTALYGIEMDKLNASIFTNVDIGPNVVRTSKAADFYRMSPSPDNVNITPRVYRSPSASDPTSGVYVIGQDIVYHSDPAAAGFIGKVPTVTGGAVGGTWAANTLYTMGVWRKTSGNKVLECVAQGTSHASTEPAPTLLGSLVTDGSATWRYRANTIATFKTFGAITA
jgi:hypothetical protein